MRVIKHWNRLHWEVAEYQSLEIIQNLTGHDPGQPAPGESEQGDWESK